MRTNIEINDELMDQAMTATALPTKRAVVEEALRRLVEAHRRNEALRDRQREALEATETALAPLPQVALSDPDTARRAAARYRHLRSLGVTVRKSNDVLIASWRLDHDAALLHRDRDFTPFEAVFGLRTP